MNSWEPLLINGRVSNVSRALDAGQLTDNMSDISYFKYISDIYIKKKMEGGGVC